jgi:hypothetical protein
MSKCDLLQRVREKIEREFGISKKFSHLDFEELLGDNRRYDRNRISVMLLSLLGGGVIRKVGMGAGAKGKQCSLYQAVKFPLSLAEVPKADKQPKVNLDEIMFNLGRGARNPPPIEEEDECVD